MTKTLICDHLITGKVKPEVQQALEDLRDSLEELYELVEAVILADELCVCLDEYENLPEDVVEKAQEYIQKRNKIFADDDQLELEF